MYSKDEGRGCAVSLSVAEAPGVGSLGTVRSAETKLGGIEKSCVGVDRSGGESRRDGDGDGDAITRAGTKGILSVRCACWLIVMSTTLPRSEKAEMYLAGSVRDSCSTRVHIAALKSGFAVESSA